MYTGLTRWKSKIQTVETLKCKVATKCEDASDIHTDDKFTLNLLPGKMLGTLADKVHCNDSHLQNKSNKQQAMSAESRFYPGWCHAPVLSGGSLIQTRWPFTKVLKTCGKFSLLPSLNPRSSRLILASPAHFASLSNFLAGRNLKEMLPEKSD